MEDQILEQVKALFQESYKIIYQDGKFDTMADQAEADGTPVNAVAQLTSAIVNSVIKDAGVTSLDVLFGLAILLISDLLEALQEVGIENQEGDFEAILNKGMQMVLADNPQIAQEIASNPKMQEALNNPEGLKQEVEQRAEQGGKMAQGVLEGAENAKGGMM